MKSDKETLSDKSQKQDQLIIDRVVACYLRINDNLFYRIRNKECVAVDVDKMRIRKSKALPSAYVENVTVITQNEFDKAFKSIGL